MSPFLGNIPTVFCRFSFQISEWVSFICGLGAFQTGVFTLFFRAGEFAHKFFKCRFSVPYSSVDFLDIIPVGFQSQMFWGFFSSLHDLTVEEPHMMHKPLTSQRNSSVFWGFLPSVDLCTLVWVFFDRRCLCLLPIFMLPSYPLL